MSKLNLFLISLFPLSLFINFIASRFPIFIDSYYSQILNKKFIELISNLTAIFPFSLLEISIFIVISFTLFMVVKLLYILLKYPSTFLRYLKNLTINLLSILSLIYFIFILFWGINYNRPSLDYTLATNYNINTSTNYSTTELSTLYKYLVNEANLSRKNVLTDKNNVMRCNSDYKDVFLRASTGLDNISYILPVDGNYGLPKAIISSELLCYTGITGIYSPFTGEANINIKNPDLYIPSTVLHEMAHQRGYASEDEANFIAYLACIHHPDSDFYYSGTILALNHVRNQLYKVDPKSYDDITSLLSADVKNDINNYYSFWNSYDSGVKEISNNINDTYLKSNGVTDGIDNYSKMVDLLLLYYDISGLF